MKKILIVLLLAILAVPIGCAKKEQGIKEQGLPQPLETSEPEEVLENQGRGVYVEVLAGSLTTEGLTLRWVNETDFEGVYGKAFLLERYLENTWTPVPVVIEGNYGFEDIGYMLSSQGEALEEIHWAWLYGALEEGSYRMIKEIYMDTRGGDNEKEVVEVKFQY